MIVGIKKEDWEKLIAAWFPPACFGVAVPRSGSKIASSVWHALVRMVSLGVGSSKVTRNHTGLVAQALRYLLLGLGELVIDEVNKASLWSYENNHTPKM